jgi:hypothetical protein
MRRRGARRIGCRHSLSIQNDKIFWVCLFFKNKLWNLNREEVVTVKAWSFSRSALGLLLLVGWSIGWTAFSQAETAMDNSTDKAQNGKSAIQTMAMIMRRLKHFPSPQSKDILQDIIDNKATAARERELATAIFNINHRASVDDKIILKKIIENPKASADERDLATVIYNLDHRPTKSDISRLEQMMQ